MRAQERSRRVGERIDDAVDDLLDQHLVLALAHDADHRLGAGWTDDQSSMRAEARLRELDRGAHLRVLQWLAALVAHVLEHLRQRVEAMTHLGYRLLAPLHHR